jgi:hypothetical protein
MWCCQATVSRPTRLHDPTVPGSFRPTVRPPLVAASSGMAWVAKAELPTCSYLGEAALPASTVRLAASAVGNRCLVAGLIWAVEGMLQAVRAEHLQGVRRRLVPEFAVGLELLVRE